MAGGTEPNTPLIPENGFKHEKQEAKPDVEIVPPDGGFWVGMWRLRANN